MVRNRNSIQPLGCLLVQVALVLKRVVALLMAVGPIKDRLTQNPTSPHYTKTPAIYLDHWAATLQPLACQNLLIRPDYCSG